MQTGGRVVGSVVLKRSFRRYTKFLIVGILNAAVDLLVLNLLLFLYPTRSGFWLTSYNTLGVVCAILNSYIWNRYWTFADVSSGSTVERAKFIAQAVLNILLNDVIVLAVSGYFTTNRAMPFVVSSNLAKAVAMFVSSSITYVFLRLFVFRRGR